MPKWHFFRISTHCKFFCILMNNSYTYIHSWIEAWFLQFSPLSTIWMFCHLNIILIQVWILTNVQTIWILIIINRNIFWNFYWIFSSSWGNLGKRVLNESYCFANYMIEQQLSSESRDGVSRYVFLTSILYLEILREITHDINIPIWISHQYIY